MAQSGADDAPAIVLFLVDALDIPGGRLKPETNSWPSACCEECAC